MRGQLRHGFATLLFVLAAAALPPLGTIAPSRAAADESDADIRAETQRLRVEIEQAREYAKTRQGILDDIEWLQSMMRLNDTCIAAGERGGLISTGVSYYGCIAVPRETYIAAMVQRTLPGAEKPLTAEELVERIRRDIRESRQNMRMLREARRQMQAELAALRQKLLNLRPPQPRPPASTQQTQVFAQPAMNGAPVDRCANFAAGCGQEGADQFCHTQGFARATKWDWHYVNRTYVIGWRNYCESAGGHCGALNDVTCVR